jgi:Ser/Thr protein kinase RdoA (MazF antagonist)
LENLVAAAGRFKPHGKVVDVREHGSGNVNDTFLVTLDSERAKHFILQRINTRVFRRPELITRNMRTVIDHVHRRIQRLSFGADRRWDLPRLLLTQEGADHWIDSGGSFWRAISFIGGAQSFDTVKDLEHGREIGYALGMFHGLMSDLPTEALADTLEGFHITPRYLRRFDEVLAPRSSLKVNYCLRFVGERRACVNVLEDAKTEGRLPTRPIHGDPKVNNVMIDTATGRAVSIVDLDTVKPGLIHYDIGDCLRSCCNPLGEETEQPEAVRFMPELCQAILRGYLPLVQGFLTESDYEYLYHAIRLTAFELGLRFLTDYLEGDVYFKVRHREHNLARALVQFKLTESIESQEAAIRALIQDMR